MNTISHDEVADILMEKPEIIRVGKRLFTIYPITLGKSLLIGKLYNAMNVNHEQLKQDPTVECLRLATAHTDSACRVIAYVSTMSKHGLFNAVKINEKIQYLKEHAGTDDIATLLLYIFTMITTEDVQKFYGIDKERERTAKIMTYKEPSNSTFTVGGKSIYGTVIDEACSRYGWTFDYVMWGISMTNLYTLLADRINTIHLTDKEAKRCKVSRDGTTIDANDPKNKNFLKRLFQD